MEKIVISSKVMMRSCTGLVLPRTAPKEIRTVAVLKSALIILQEKEEKFLRKKNIRSENKKQHSIIICQSFSIAFKRNGLWFIEQLKSWLCIFYLMNHNQRVTKKHTQKRHSYLKMLILILPSSMCQNPCMRRPHCRPKAARSMLMPTLLNPYRFRKVIRNPKPMNIMT